MIPVKTVDQPKEKKFFNCLIFFFKYNNLTYEEQSKRLFMFFISFVVFFAGIFAILFVFITYTVKYRQILDGITLITCISLIFVINVFFFVCKSGFQVYVFLFNCFVSICCIVVHFAGTYKGGIVEGGPLFSMCCVVIISTFFGNNFQFVLWTILFFLVYLGGIIRDVFFVDVVEYINYKVDTESNMKVVTLFIYFNNLLPFSVFMFTVFYYHFSKKRINESIDTIGDCILNLDFDNPRIQKFVVKPKKYSTKFERLLKGIIANLKTYKLYLPDSIKQRLSLGDDDIDSKRGSNGSFISSYNPIASSNGSLDSAATGEDVSSRLSSSSTKTIIELKERKILYGMKTKEVVVLECFIANFYDNVIDNFNGNLKDIKKLEKFEEFFLDVVSSVLYSNKGIVNEIFADRILSTFNAQNTCTDSENRACDSALKIIEKFKEEYPDVSVVITIIKSELLVGNLKSKYHSKFFLVSPKFRTLKRIKLYNTKRSTVLVDSNIFESIKYYYKTKIVNVIDDYDRIYKVLRREQTHEMNENREWIYVLDKHHLENDDGSDIYHLAWDEYMKRNYTKAEELILEYYKEHKEDMDAFTLIEKIKEEERGSTSHFSAMMWKIDL